MDAMLLLLVLQLLEELQLDDVLVLLLEHVSAAAIGACIGAAADATGAADIGACVDAALSTIIWGIYCGADIICGLGAAIAFRLYIRFTGLVIFTTTDLLLLLFLSLFLLFFYYFFCHSIILYN